MIHNFFKQFDVSLMPVENFYCVTRLLACADATALR